MHSKMSALQQKPQLFLEVHEPTRSESLEELRKTVAQHGLTIDHLESVFRHATIERLHRSPIPWLKYSPARIRLGTRDSKESYWCYLEQSEGTNHIISCILYTDNGSWKIAHSKLDWSNIQMDEWVHLCWGRENKVNGSLRSEFVKFMARIALLLHGAFDGKVTLDEADLSKAHSVWGPTLTDIRENLKVRQPVTHRDQSPSTTKTSAQDGRTVTSVTTSRRPDSAASGGYTLHNCTPTDYTFYRQEACVPGRCSSGLRLSE